MTMFTELLPLILAEEGVSASNPTGYADIPGDPGGETKWGISQRAWNLTNKARPEYAGYPALVKDFTRQHAERIYYHEYWLATECDMYPKTLAYLLFDCAVNQGVGTSKQIFQRALGVKDDGQIGTKTKAAFQARLAAGLIKQLLEDMLWARLDEYRDDTARSVKANAVSAFPGFLYKLWIPRLQHVRANLSTL